jgi:hypothetical protein
MGHPKQTRTKQIGTSHRSAPSGRSSLKANRARSQKGKRPVLGRQVVKLPDETKLATTNLTHLLSQSACGVKRAYWGYRESLYHGLALSYAVGRFLMNNRKAWKKFCRSPFWESFDGIVPKSEDSSQAPKAVAAMFADRLGRTDSKTRSKFAAALECLSRQNVSAEKAAEKLKKIGIEKLARQQACSRTHRKQSRSRIVLAAATSEIEKALGRVAEGCRGKIVVERKGTKLIAVSAKPLGTRSK